MKRGFTLVEMLIVIAIMVVVASAAVPLYGSLQVKAQLGESTSQIVQSIRIARANAVSGFNSTSSGIYFFINPVGADTYTIYQGGSYASRNASYDQVNTLDNALSINNIGFVLVGGSIDINFARGSGKPGNTGSFNLIHSVQGTSTISLNNLGLVQQN